LWLQCVAALPQGFTDELLFVADRQPLALRWLPDGRVLVLERLGRITLASADGSQTVTYMILPNVAQGVELGLFDLALHPEFEKTKQFYIYYSPLSPERLRVSVFTHEENDGGMTSRGLSQSEIVIYQEPDTSYQSACCHYGGGERRRKERNGSQERSQPLVRLVRNAASHSFSQNCSFLCPL
jgi:hypothetical protein